MPSSSLSVLSVFSVFLSVFSVSQTAEHTTYSGTQQRESSDFAAREGNFPSRNGTGRCTGYPASVVRNGEPAREIGLRIRIHGYVRVVTAG